MSQDSSQGKTRTDLPDVATKFGRLAFLGLGALYTLGLLIVNSDLGRYGIVTLNLARPEYVMAGALWCFLTIGMLAVGQAVMLRMKEALKSKNPSQIIMTTVSSFLALAFIPFMALNTLSHGSIANFFNWGPWLLILVIYSNSFSLSVLIRNSSELFAEGIPSLTRLVKVEAAMQSPLYLVIGMLINIGIYTIVVFPQIPREVGGGNRPVVEIFLSEDPEPFWNETKFPISKETKRVGPVILLLETETSYVIGAIEPQERDVWFPYRKTASAVSVEKKLVSGVVYKAEKNPE